MNDFFHSSGKPLSRHVVVLYDKGTGEIRHVHEEIILSGAKVHLTEAAAFKQIRRQEEFVLGSKVLSTEKSRLAALHLSHLDLRPEIDYRVDLKRKRIVEVSEKVTKKRKTRRKAM
jgi:hypothetical protein